MPYRLSKSPTRDDLFYVVSKNSNARHSKKPMRRSRALRQMRALYAAEQGYVLRGSKPRRVRGGGLSGRDIKYGATGALGAALLTRGNPLAVLGVGALGVLASRRYPKELK